MNAFDLFTKAFDRPRMERSAAYRQGVMAVLAARIDHLPMPRCPFTAGTAEADAWYSGCFEGHDIAQRATDHTRKEDA